MKKLKVYYKGEFITEIEYDRIRQNDNTKCWEVFSDEKLTLSAFIPFDYLIVKETENLTFTVSGNDLLGIINNRPNTISKL